MTNLEWIRTLSAKELSDLLYDYWLPRGQYVWTDSRKGLVKMLGENHLERDCDKCKHQGDCYCVKGLGCPYEPKTEPTYSEKPNNCEDDEYWEHLLIEVVKGHMSDAEANQAWYEYINHKDEPQTSCKTCRFGEVDEGYVRCAYYSKATEQDEPQTERSENEVIYTWQDEQEYNDRWETERSE